MFFEVLRTSPGGKKDPVCDWSICYSSLKLGALASGDYHRNRSSEWSSMYESSFSLINHADGNNDKKIRMIYSECMHNDSVSLKF